MEKTVLKFTIYWIVLKFWAQTRKLQYKEDSKIDQQNSINGSMFMENDIYLEISALWYAVDWVLYVNKH